MHLLFQYSRKNSITKKRTPEEKLNTAETEGQEEEEVQVQPQVQPPNFQILDLTPETPEVRPSPISIFLSFYNLFCIVYIS